MHAIPAIIPSAIATPEGAELMLLEPLAPEGIASVDEIGCDGDAADVDCSAIVLVSVMVVSEALFGELAIEEGDRAEMILEEIEAENDEDRL
jgi:hypothetical protein